MNIKDIFTRFKNLFKKNKLVPKSIIYKVEFKNDYLYKGEKVKAMYIQCYCSCIIYDILKIKKEDVEITVFAMTNTPLYYCVLKTYPD